MKKKLKSLDREYTDEALRSFFGGRKAYKPDRPQTVNTPKFLIDAINELWPEGITLDPCSNPGSIVGARYEIFEGGVARENLIDDHSYLYMSYDSRYIAWPDRTFCNPPYRTLSEWLRIEVGREYLFLVPHRTNRKWYRRWLSKATRFCALNPFAYAGHKQTFPAPVDMAYFGLRVEVFERIFCKFGDVGVYVLCSPV